MTATGTTSRSLAYLAGVPAERVKGIGPRSAKKLGDNGIHSVADLLLHVPRRYLDRSQLFDLASVPLGEEVTVGGTVLAVELRRLSKNRKRTSARISDGTNLLTVTWFNPYVKVAKGADVVLSGKVERFRGRLQMSNPDIDTLDPDSLLIGRVVPIHPAVGGLSPTKIRSAIANALPRARPIEDPLPRGMVERLGLMERDAAIGMVHFPDQASDASRARERLVFDELFRLEVALALQKHRQIEGSVGIAHDGDGTLAAAFLDALPYSLTGAQRRAIEELDADMTQAHPMHRLLQGEVGSGKTVVAAAALLTAVQGGHQGAVMAPTEVLAVQHYLGLRDLLEEAGLDPPRHDPSAPEGMVSLFGGETADGPVVRLALLTSSSAEVNFVAAGAARRADVIRWIADGMVDLVVGTHSLIQDAIEFAGLGLAVVDEQHRFGVHQRVQLKEKADGYAPDVLIMTATPIPRTLSMTLYGDLDVSVLDEMPPGRLPCRTRHVRPADIAEVYDLIRHEAGAGRQAFVVCPLVEDSDKLEAASATAEHERLSSILAPLRVGLMHGQLRPSEKEDVMRRFRRGELDVLVATTVIEVGIDIPNATVMVIEDADRFGLSQLHQLRGRVGRGSDQATCVLVADPSTDVGEQRIAAMVATTDGFRLAEEDLRIRGQGTVFGARQAGLKDLKLADILRDAETLAVARREAFALVASDPDLRGSAPVAEEVRAMLGADVEWLFKS
jgi:ATP-dependent DNA helicase RecG